MAATLKYADSIIRNFATAGAIILSTIMGYIYLNGVVDLTVGIGIICTVVAIFNYTLDTTAAPEVLPLVKPSTSAVDDTISISVKAGLDTQIKINREKENPRVL